MNKCPECHQPVDVWADNSGGVTVNFRCHNASCPSGKPPWDTAPDEDTCPRCGGETDPDWFCSEGYCPTCCEATDEGED